MNNLINIEQNEKKFLAYRYMSRILYTKEKKWLNILLFIGVLVSLIGYIPIISTWRTAIIIPIIWAVISYLVQKKCESTHKDAVDYHELSDREMFKLGTLQSFIKNKERLFVEAIQTIENEEHKVKFNEMCKAENKISIKDWYSNFTDLPLEVAILLAQNENISWENKQRDKYKKILWVLISICVLSSVLIYAITNSLINTFFVVPIIFEFIKLNIDNNNSIKKCKDILQQIAEGYMYIQKEGKGFNTQNILENATKVQFAIYENRKESIPVPDIVYKTFRKKLQAESTASMGNIKEEVELWLK